MKKVLAWLDEYFEVTLCVILMLGMTFTIFYQVVMRYVFSASQSWSEELARYMFVWLICLGVSYGAKLMKHIKIDAGLKLFPRTARRWVVMAGDLFFLGFALYVAYTGFKLAGLQVRLNKVSPGLGLPLVYLNAAPAVGFLLASFRQVQTIVHRWNHRNDPETEPTLEEVIA